MTSRSSRGAARAPSQGAKLVTPARVVENGDSEVRLAVNARAPGRLLLETYYPGWKAEVERQGEEIRPANAPFRSVTVPAGSSEVRFRYRPALVGRAVSVVSLVVLAALAVLGYRRRRW